MYSDDERDLRAVAVELSNVEARAGELRAKRLAIAARLRDDGLPMGRIARLAGVSDTYLARQLIARGAKRRVIRGR